MRILLDENMPPNFGKLLPDHQVVHVEDMGQKGIRNGELLKIAREF
jgi:predicted nuclease of predicted toxin-antitoxin system